LITVVITGTKSNQQPADSNIPSGISTETNTVEDIGDGMMSILSNFSEGTKLEGRASRQLAGGQGCYSE